MPSPSTLASKVRSLLNDSRELERLRKENASLLIEVKALRQDQAEVAKLLGGSGRAPSGARASAVKSGATRKTAGGKRFRTSAAEVDRMTQTLAKAAPSDWKTKAEIVKAAGLKLDSVAAAWKRVTEGYELDGKKHAPVLKSNGSRGLKGRYRKA